MKVAEQWSELYRDIQALHSTPLVAELHITPEDLIWATDVVISRSFAGPKQLGQSKLIPASLLVMLY